MRSPVRAGPILLSGSAATIYTCPPLTKTGLQRIQVSNETGSAATLFVSLGADAVGTRIYNSYSVAAHDRVSLRGPFILNDSDVVQAFSGTANALSLTLEVLENTIQNPGFSISPSGRFIVDPSGQPFLFRSEFSGGFTINLPLANVPAYLDQLLAYKFNSFAVELMTQANTGSGWAPTSPFDDRGQLPFLLNTSGGAWDGTPDVAAFDSPNDDYFAYAEEKYALGAARRMLMRMQVLCWGFRGSQNGWWRTTGSVPAAHNTVAVHTALGDYLARGHGPFGGLRKNPYIMLIDGGDWGIDNSVTPESTGFEDRPLALANAMIAGGCRQLHMFDGQAPSLSSTEPFWDTKFLTSVQGSYTYGGVPITSTDTTTQLRTYELARLGWNYTNSDGRPVACFLRETAFSGSSFVPGTDEALRHATYWHYTSGGTAGTEHGIDGPTAVWTFNSVSASMAELTSNTSVQDMVRFFTLVLTLPWTLFVPSELSGMPKLIVGARGSQTGLPTDYIGALQSSDGSCLFVYTPSTGTGTQTFSVNLTAMGAGTLTARWWDPTSGSFTSIGGSFDNSMSSKSVTTPGTNSSGTTNDWVLLVQQ